MAANTVAEFMRELHIPLTRKNFIDLNWFGTPPSPWTPEDEMALPAELQDWTQFDDNTPMPEEYADAAIVQLDAILLHHKTAVLWRETRDLLQKLRRQAMTTGDWRIVKKMLEGLK